MLKPQADHPLALTSPQATQLVWLTLAVELLQALHTDPYAQKVAGALAGARGFTETGLFPIFSSGPTNATFNWGDSDGGEIG